MSSRTPWEAEACGSGLWLLVTAEASCARSGLDADEWYPVSAGVLAARREAAAAIAVCVACLVRRQCLELSLRDWRIGQHGVWGATVPAEREALRRTLMLRNPGTTDSPEQIAAPFAQTDLSVYCSRITVYSIRSSHDHRF
jgi:hypothetical protein